MAALAPPLALLLALAGCAVRPPAPAPAEPAREPAAAPPPAAPADAPEAGATLLRPRARWVAQDWSALPGWSDDRVAELWLGEFSTSPVGARAGQKNLLGKRSRNG